MTELLTGAMRAPVKTLRERDIQEACVRWARANGWWARKFASPANRSVPDYIFGKQGCTVFVEFKAPGKKPTEAQLEEHAAMAKAGLMVHVVDNVQTFKDRMTEWDAEWQKIAEVLST